MKASAEQVGSVGRRPGLYAFRARAGAIFEEIWGSGFRAGQKDRANVQSLWSAAEALDRQGKNHHET